MQIIKVKAQVGPLFQEKPYARDCEGRIGLIRAITMWFKIVMQMTQQHCPVW